MECALNGHNTLIMGQAGTGKSTLLKALKKELEKRGKKVAVTATTGIGMVFTLKQGRQHLAQNRIMTTIWVAVRI